MDKEKIIKILKKSANLEKGGNIALAKEFDSIDEKLDNLSEELKKKPELVLDFSKEELSNEIVDTVESKLIPKINLLEAESTRKINEAVSVVSEKHKDALLEVRQLSNKKGKIIDDKLAKVKDGYTPIKGKDYFDGKPGKDGSPDKPLEIATKLNTLEEVIDQKVIKGLTKKISDLSQNIAHSAVEKGAKLYTGTSETRVREIIAETPSGGGTLAQTLALGNLTGGNNILIGDASNASDTLKFFDNFSDTYASLFYYDDSLYFLLNSGVRTATFDFRNLASSRSYAFPNASGTIALTSDITGTVSSVAMTVPTGLTISGSPITSSGTLAVALDTGYVIPLQSTLDGKLDGTMVANRVPYGVDANTLTTDADLTFDGTTLASGTVFAYSGSTGTIVERLKVGGQSTFYYAPTAVPTYPNRNSATNNVMYLNGVPANVNYNWGLYNSLRINGYGGTAYGYRTAACENYMLLHNTNHISSGAPYEWGATISAVQLVSGSTATVLSNLVTRTILNDAGTTITLYKELNIAAPTFSGGAAVTTYYGIYQEYTSALNYIGGKLGIGQTSASARLHIAAGTATAGTAPIKLTSGTSTTVAVAGQIEMTTDDLFFTITTGAARKNITLWDTLGTSGRVPYATTNGRLTDSANLTFDGANLGVTGTRIPKGWFTDIESTNMPTVGGTAILTSLTAPQFTTIELGHATDTTLSRVSAGVAAIEGENIYTTKQIKTVYKTTTETVNNSTTLQDDDELLFPVLANEVWAVQLFIQYDTGTTPDIKFQWSLPASATSRMQTMPFYDANFFTGSASDDIAGFGAGTTAAVFYTGTVIVAGTAGNVVLQWAQNTLNASDTKVLAGSYLIATRLV